MVLPYTLAATEIEVIVNKNQEECCSSLQQMRYYPKTETLGVALAELLANVDAMLVCPIIFLFLLSHIDRTVVQR